LELYKQKNQKFIYATTILKKYEDSLITNYPNSIENGRLNITPFSIKKIKYISSSTVFDSLFRCGVSEIWVYPHYKIYYKTSYDNLLFSQAEYIIFSENQNSQDKQVHLPHSYSLIQYLILGEHYEYFKVDVNLD
jgi:hypothetical protein